jgi:hypothetical protein
VFLLRGHGLSAAVAARPRGAGSLWAPRSRQHATWMVWRKTEIIGRQLSPAADMRLRWTWTAKCQKRAFRGSPEYCEVGRSSHVCPLRPPSTPETVGRCRERCSEGIMRGAWVEIIIIGTHTLRAPSPLTAASTLTKSKVCAGHSSETLRTHTKKTKRRSYAPGLLKPR